MKKITNGTQVYEVTNGAYETIYKPMGFYPFGDEPDVDVKEAVAEDAGASETGDEPAEAEEAEEKSQDEQWCEELEKKPIGQWNKAEVKKYAEIRGIDITGTKSINEARDRIKAAQDNESW